MLHGPGKNAGAILDGLSPSHGVSLLFRDCHGSTAVAVVCVRSVISFDDLAPGSPVDCPGFFFWSP